MFRRSNQRPSGNIGTATRRSHGSPAAAPPSNTEPTQARERARSGTTRARDHSGRSSRESSKAEQHLS